MQTMKRTVAPMAMAPPRDMHLVQSLWRAHTSLDGQAAHVLPSLLQQRDEVVNGQHDVTDQIILSHLDVTDSDTQAKDLFQLELDGALDLGDLRGQIFVVRDRGRELAGLGKTGTEETRNLLDKGIGGDKGVVLASELLDKLLIFVELLQVIGRHGVDTVVLSTIDVVLVTKNAVLKVRICPSFHVFRGVWWRTKWPCLVEEHGAT